MPYRDPEKQRASQAEYRARNKKRIAEYDKEYRSKNKEKRKKQYLEWYSDSENAKVKKDRDRAYGARRRESRRALIFEVLGDVCVRCGFSDKRALEVDHINGGGNLDRLSARTMDRYYARIIEVGKSEYQILCANCNRIKEHEEGAFKRR